MSDYIIKNQRDRTLIIWIALLATPLTGAGVDIYVPSLPALAHYFTIPNYLAQLSLTIYLIGYGLFTLVAGPLADRFGRRKVLMCSSLLAVVFCLVAALSPNIYWLIASRFMQGVAISGLGVVVRTLFPDTFQGKTLRKIMPFLMTSWAAGPILAPYIGGHLQHWVGWQGSFYFLAGYGFLIFLLSFILPETLRHRHELTYHVIKRNYSRVFTSRLFYGWTFMSSLLYAFLVVFAVVAPFLIENVMHYSPIFYGKIALLMGVVWFIGSLVARSIAHIHPTRILPTLCITGVVASIAVFVYIINSPLIMINLVVPVFILLLIAAVMFSFSYGSSLSLFPSIGGTNSASTGAVLSLSVGVISSLAVMLKTNTDTPLFFTVFGFFVIAGLLYFLVVRKPLHQDKE